LSIQLQNEKHAHYPAAFIHTMQFRGGCLAFGGKQKVSVLGLLQMFILFFFSNTEHKPPMQTFLMVDIQRKRKLILYFKESNRNDLSIGFECMWHNKGDW